jgi:CD109 antigen
LEAKCVQGEKFEKFARLSINAKKNSVLIQTDKAMYKPGDNVQFRVLVMDRDMKPATNANVAIFISDGAQNRVKQFDNIVFNKGVFENSMQLSELPVMGNWRINVKVNGVDTVKQFEVNKYTLPTFDMKLDSSPFIAFRDGKISVNVLAKYTFGKLATGNATVTATYGGGYRARGSGYFYSPAISVSKTGPIDGKKPFEFDMDTELKITDKTNNLGVSLKATFKEELTGKEIQANAHVWIFQHPFTIGIGKSAPKFKTGLPYSVKAVVTSLDKNAPITDERNPLEFTVKHYYDEVRRCERYLQPHTTKAGQVFDRNATEFFTCREEKSFDLVSEAFLINGTAKIDIEAPDNSNRFDVTVKYLGATGSERNIYRAASACDQYIQIRSLTEKPRIGENLEIEVATTADVSQVNYQISNRGEVVDSNVLASEGSRVFTLTIEPTFAMLPSAKVLVFYIVNGEIISDSIDVVFESSYRNPVSTTS